MTIKKYNTPAPALNNPAPGLAKYEPGELLRLGHVLKAHGIKGEVSLDYWADSLRLLQPTLFLQAVPGLARQTAAALRAGGVFEPDLNLGPLTEHKVLGARRHQGHALVLLEGINNRDQAEALRGQPLLLPRARLPRLPKGEVYLYELPGFTVYLLREDGAQEELGVIREVDLNSGHELWCILTPAGQEVLFPAEGDFVRELDPKNRRAVISPPPGLLELYI